MDSYIGDGVPSTPGKIKVDRPHYILSHRSRWQTSLWKLGFWSGVFLFFIFLFFARSPSLPDPVRRSASAYGGPAWEKRVRSSAHLRRNKGISVLVTGAAGFVGSHVSHALKRRGDGVLGLDNFNDYYDPSLKRARRDWLDKAGVFIVDGDINDVDLLRKLLDVVRFTHVMHLAAQAGVRYAMKNPTSYVRSNIGGFVNLLEVCKGKNPQPAKPPLLPAQIPRSRSQLRSDVAALLPSLAAHRAITAHSHHIPLHLIRHRWCAYGSVSGSVHFEDVVDCIKVKIVKERPTGVGRRDSHRKRLGR